MTRSPGARRAGDAAGDLAAIGDEDRGEHQAFMSPRRARRQAACAAGLRTGEQQGLSTGDRHERADLRLQHLGDSCRRPAGPGDRRARHADLPDDVLCLRGRAACRRPVRAEGLRQHLHPHHEPDPGGARIQDRRARRRHRGPCRGVGPCRPVHRLSHADAAGRRIRCRAPALRRLDQPVQPRLQVLRLACGVGRCRKAGELRGRPVAEDQGDLRRIDRQSRRAHHRYRRHRRGRPQGAGAAHRRQHAGHALSVPALRARRQHHRPLADQVHGRARQLHRRRDRRRRHLRLGQGRQVPAAERAQPVLQRHQALRDLRQHRLCHRLPGARACATSGPRSRRSTPS
jgi:hypothetical protein